MSKHLGKRERVARKRRNSMRKGILTVQDSFGVITLKLGRKKFSEAFYKNSILLKNKFSGCVVEAER